MHAAPLAGRRLRLHADMLISAALRSLWNARHVRVLERQGCGCSLGCKQVAVQPVRLQQDTSSSQSGHAVWKAHDCGIHIQDPQAQVHCWWPVASPSDCSDAGTNLECLHARGGLVKVPPLTSRLCTLLTLLAGTSQPVCSVVPSSRSNPASITMASSMHIPRQSSEPRA
jgi:hypothetical protein